MIDEAVEALRSGRAVVLPFDTVYGLVALADEESAVHGMYELKGRMPTQPTALVAATVQQLLEALPEVADDRAIQTLLPGPFTLILANPGRRYRWLTGENPDAIGVRVPELPPVTAAVVAQVGAVVATSANDPRGADPAVFEEVPHRIRDGAGAAIDGGRVPGTPSTVLDLTGTEPRILREGAVPRDEVLRRLSAPVRS